MLGIVCSITMNLLPSSLPGSPLPLPAACLAGEDVWGMWVRSRRGRGHKEKVEERSDVRVIGRAGAG